MCRDLGWLRTDALPADPEFGKLKECPCGLVHRKRMCYFDETFGFTGPLQNERLETIADIQGNEAGKKAIKAYLAKPGGWLYLWGIYGDGKTKLLAVIINELRQRKQDAVFCVVPDLLDYLRSTFGPSSEHSFAEAWGQIKNVQVLGLDDIATENPTEWATEKIYELVNWRYRLELPTIVTSNREPDRLRDPRLASRFMDVRLGRVVNCGNVDVRRLTR